VQASLLRVPLAGGTLIATNDLPSKELVPSLLATSDVLGTGCFAARRQRMCSTVGRSWSLVMEQLAFSVCFQPSCFETKAFA
jgi:hypothetical protein